MDDDNITNTNWTSVNISKTILLTRLCRCVPHFCLLVYQRNHQILQSYIYHESWLIDWGTASQALQSNMAGYKNPCSLMFPSPSIGFPSCSQAHCGRYIPHLETPCFSHIAGHPMILPSQFLMPIMLCHVWLPNIKWSHLTGQQSLTGQLPRLLGGLIKGSIHVRHQPQDQGDAVDVGHGPLPPRESWAGKSSKNAGWLAILTSFIVMIIYDNGNFHHKVRVLQSPGLAINQLLFCLTVQVGWF